MSFIICGLAYRLARVNPCVSVRAALVRKKGSIATPDVSASQGLQALIH